MGQKPTDEEVFNLIALVDDNMSNTIDFPEFLKVCFAHDVAHGGFRFHQFRHVDPNRSRHCYSSLPYHPHKMQFNCAVYIGDQVIKIQKQKAKSVDDESDICSFQPP